MNQKSIIVDADVHTKFKNICRNKNLKIGALTEDLIRLYVENPKSIQQLIDELKR